MLGIVIIMIVDSDSNSNSSNTSIILCRLISIIMTLKSKAINRKIVGGSCELSTDITCKVNIYYLEC